MVDLETVQEQVHVLIDEIQVSEWRRSAGLPVGTVSHHRGDQNIGNAREAASSSNAYARPRCSAAPVWSTPGPGRTAYGDGGRHPRRDRKLRGIGPAEEDVR